MPNLLPYFGDTDFLAPDRPPYAETEVPFAGRSLQIDIDFEQEPNLTAGQLALIRQQLANLEALHRANTIES